MSWATCDQINKIRGIGSGRDQESQPYEPTADPRVFTSIAKPRNLPGETITFYLAFETSAGHGYYTYWNTRSPHTQPQALRIISAVCDYYDKHHSWPSRQHEETIRQQVAANAG